MTPVYLSFKKLSEITGITKMTLMRQSKLPNNNLETRTINGNGGEQYEVLLYSLPAKYQTAYVLYIKDTEGDTAAAKISAMLPFLAPAAAETALTILAPPEPAQDLFPAFAEVLPNAAGRKGNGTGSSYLPVKYEWQKLPAWSPERAISEKTLTDKRVGRIMRILREVEDIPRGWDKGTDAWIKFVAAKHNVARQTIYRWKDKYNKRGLAGVEHRKSTRDNPKAWTLEALDWWIALCLKPAHSKINLEALYEDVLIIEAQRRAWRIGCLESAVWWFNKRATPTMRALQKGGMLALDNIMPPILRKYNDLAPFEMLVGDQHRYDFWVVDDDTGQVFRPECFMWQDLRTRLIYGMAFDHHYDAHLCGLALRIGMRVWGCFNSIYTDNGKPELSKYMMGIMAQIREHGMEWKQTEDAPIDILDVDAEEINPVIEPGTHKKAIVKNAKAKMIEGTFSIFEDILRSRFRLSGSVKRLTDDIHTQDVDHEGAMTLAVDGRMMLASEFYLTCYQAIDYYNRQKVHRGVRKEWMWQPKPATATPMDCLKFCYEDGWRPKVISDEAADMIFLKRASRVVNRGRLSIEGETYEHNLLLDLHGERVDIRYNPIEADLVHVYRQGAFLCAASPVEYSSMKDDDLARRKIVEKREKRKAIADRFREMTRHIPDFRAFSTIPKAEKIAAQIGEEKRRQEQARITHEKPMSPEQYEAEMAKMEAMNILPPKKNKPLPGRPTEFTTKSIRHDWCLKYEIAGGELSAEDRAFVEKYESESTPEARERWQFEREYGREYGAV